MSLPPLDIPKELSLADGLYEALKEAVINGSIKPGAKLTELSVANHVNISRTPVRQALQRLQNEGMLESSGRSLIVAGVSLETIAELCIVRATLEGLAAGLAATKRSEADLFTLQELIHSMRKAVVEGDIDSIVRYNQAFHKLIWECAQNSFLSQQLYDIRKSIIRMQTSTLHSKDRQIESLNEHEEILKALQEGNAEQAEKVTREHFRKAEAIRIMMIRMKDIDNQ